MTEAQSLASVTELAFNPPARADDAVKQVTSSLTLYIVRVPGSRDVFLTPLKPRERVVNAQDVQSSLYFLHVDSPEDFTVREDPKPSVPATPTIREESTFNIHRKPIGAVPARRPLPTPPASPELYQQQPSVDYLGVDWNASVPARKPLVPRRSPDRELRPRPVSTVSALPNGTCQDSVLIEQCQTLTLIRRDPSTGRQWNIAKISDPPVDEVSSEALKENRAFPKRVKNSGSPLYLDIKNTGYNPFISSDLPLRHAEHLPLPESPEERIFKRRIWMDGSRFANHSYATRRPFSVTSDGFSNVSTSNLSLQSARQSVSSVAIDRRSKGYAFEDAWGNKCEFSTATTGRALRCRQIRNVPAPGYDAPQVDVSELRFNLPSHHFSARSESNINNEHNARRNSYFSNDTSSDASSLRSGHTRMRSEDGTVDYSLGRERAGGGFGGRDAKLGKLIVEEMGQKMLDLVVAANMALWWRAYEKCS
ncbi:ATP-dependent DNA helicase hus2/rqh1 [Sphaceloma murrayae]|uniref:ATP-dependent DNA helicase hus2/rqh1 n=1 Tax=Sphaceloma murrayae TaxID=2082308 RepID=A0A2K1R094_9PEZI|nr:ATP-dependent DNA helicase hus2/rqh1 [Sphaceloma murrayae]